MQGPVSAEVVTTSAADMIAEGRELPTTLTPSTPRDSVDPCQVNAPPSSFERDSAGPQCALSMHAQIVPSRGSLEL